MFRFGREEASPMQVKVNGQTIEIFAGARVGDVLRKYSRAEWTLVRKKEKKVSDPHGHEVGLDGELNGGEELVTKACVPAEPRS
jgi:sulfur carrier protein ThiS